MYFQLKNEKIYLDFNDGITVKVDGPKIMYLVECLEYPKNDILPKYVDSNYITTKCDWPYKQFDLPIEFFFDFEIKIYQFNISHGLKLIFSHRYNDYDQLVRFILDTENYDEAVLWLEKIKSYQQIHHCKTQIISKFEDINSQSDSLYQTRNLTPYKTYKLGRHIKNSNDWKTVDPRKENLLWFGNWKTFWSYQHPRLWKNLTSEEIANDILGL